MLVLEQAKVQEASPDSQPRSWLEDSMIKRMVAGGDCVSVFLDVIQDLLVCARDRRTIRSPVPQPRAEGVRGDGQIPSGILKRPGYGYRVVDAALYCVRGRNLRSCDWLIASRSQSRAASGGCYPLG